MVNKKKLATAGVAVVTAAALMLGGTFAWQSISQTALNEASDVINPGGRLHDDFNGENKDIYVENFADDPIYARVRLEEYFEIIANYQFLEDQDTSNDYLAVSNVILGGEETDEEGNTVRTYTLFNNYDSLADKTLKAGVDGDYDGSAAEGEDGYAYWSWKTGGSTVYMPTFNMNKDSLKADINGIYEEGIVGTISERVLDMEAEGAQYSDYTNWAEYKDDNGVIGVGATKSGTEIYDADANDIDDEDVTEVAATHEVKNTGSGSLISMSKWLAMVEYDDEGNVVSAPGDYWVYDSDGWVYWSAPIEPDTATGLLMDGIELNQVMDDTWYYAINVVAQFVTADDVGKTDGTGFYANDEDPTAEAEELLAAIGVDMSGEAADDGTTGGEGEEGDESEIQEVILETDEVDYRTITVQVNERFLINESGPYVITYMDDSTGSAVPLTSDQFIEENMAATITDVRLVGKTLTLKNTSGGNGCYVVVEAADDTTTDETETPTIDTDLVLTTAGNDSSAVLPNRAVTVTIEDSAAIDTTTLNVTDESDNALTADQYTFGTNNGNYFFLVPDETYAGQTLTITVSSEDGSSTYKGIVSIIQTTSSEDNVTEETSGVSSIALAYEMGTDDGSGNVTYTHNVWENEFKWNFLTVSAYDAEGNDIDGYSSYTYTISNLTVTDGYYAQQEGTSHYVYQNGVTSYAMVIDTKDGSFGISGAQSEDEVPVDVFGEDLTVTYTVTVADSNGTASALLNMTVKIDVAEDPVPVDPGDGSGEENGEETGDTGVFT